MRLPWVSLVVLASACGPSIPPGGPGEPGTAPARAPAAVEGEVLGVDHVAPTDRLASGVRLRLQPGASEVVVIDLAPDWYLNERGISFSRAERVRVEGARVEQSGRIVIYATRVRKGGKTVELREPGSGKPLWNEKAPE
ncbi:MAG: hypothetical protein HYZ29_13850 [Myxococcales bacterium]|nr:hypothetical protein [Myxococcales bacterium]